MKVTFVCDQVLSAVKSVIGAVAQKSTVPILSHVLIVADGSQWKITGSNLELSLIATLDLESEPFSICLPAKKLLDVLKSFAKDAIVGLGIDDEKATIRCGRSRFTFNTLSAQDYPQIDTNQLIPITQIDQEVLSTLIRSTIHAMAEKDVRYYLNGLCFDFNQFNFNVVGTDGHRLAMRGIELSEPVLKKELIIPRDTIEELNKLLDQGQCSISGTSSSYVNSGDVVVTMNGIVVELEKLTLISKLIDGRFPDYQRVIPQNYEHRVIFDERFDDAIHRTGLILDKKTDVGIALEFSKNQVRVVAKTSEDEAEEFIDIDHDADEVVLGLNASYVEEALGAIRNEKVLFSFSDGQSSVKIESVDHDEGISVIMPMRL